MGVFEQGGQHGTLHFHTLVYVPKDSMIGEIVERKEYSKKRGEVYTRYANTFFDESFGMSDFQELNPILLKRGGTLKYLIKYIVKTGEKIVYSRGIPAEICIELADSDIAGTFFNFVTKYVLFDDVIDWERDIKDYGKKRQKRRLKRTKMRRITPTKARQAFPQLSRKRRRVLMLARRLRSLARLLQMQGRLWTA